MQRRDERRLRDEQRTLAKTRLSQSVGVVTDDSPFTVRIEGEEHLGLKRLASYTPATNDVVLVIRSGKTWTVLGEIV